MKKIMIAMVAVALATVTHAATVSWAVSTARNANTLRGQDGTTVFGKTAGDAMYLIDFTKSEAIITALASGTLSATTDGVFDSVTSGFGTYGGITERTTGDVLTAGQEYSFAVLLVSSKMNAETEEMEYFYNLGTEMTRYPSTTEAKTSLAFSKATNFATQTWTTAEVPEPTSGLLLLLGVAGLALRRKSK